MKNLKIACSSLLLSSILCSCALTSNNYNEEVRLETEITEKISLETVASNQTLNILVDAKPCEMIVEPNIKSITISAVGDCTLGTDIKYGLNNSFLEKSTYVDDGYFFGGVKDVLANDDYTIANLECVLTDSLNCKDKEFTFRGKREFVNILKEGSVECVNTANNHSKDFYDIGYDDTIKLLENNLIDHFGYETISVREIKGIKIANAGFTSYYAGYVTYSDIKNALDQMEEMGADIKIITIHGGYEGEYQFDSIKEDFAHYAIDNGADLVLGHHPHVLQGIEEYKGKNIVYSLGNFCYGGSRSLKDPDSMIYQQTFTFENDELIDTKVKIIPVSISSTKALNDFRPTLVSEEEENRIINKVLSYSKNFTYSDE